MARLPALLYFLGGPELEPVKASNMSAKRQRRAKNKIARAFNARLEQGSIKGAAAVLEKSELVEPNAETIQTLAELHPHADTRNVDNYTPETLVKVLGASQGFRCRSFRLYIRACKSCVCNFESHRYEGP